MKDNTAQDTFEDEQPIKTTPKDMMNTHGLSERELAIFLLKENGMTTPQVEKALNYQPRSSYKHSKKLKGLKKKYDLTSNSNMKIAYETLVHCAKGETFGEVKHIKDSTALTASKMFYDRAQPVINRNENLNFNVPISPVDLSRYISGNTPPPIVDDDSDTIEVTV